MKKQPPQAETWAAAFGKEYTDRNPHSIEQMDALYQTNFGVTRIELNARFLGALDRSATILEVGSNVGTQLKALQTMGFGELYGIELQSYAVELSKILTQGINLIQGSAFELPFRDRFFDLVFTSGVLIHISPEDLPRVLDEMHRCSREFIWGFEYFATQHTEIPYRGMERLMWKGDFARLFLDRFPDLERVREERIPYLNAQGNEDVMYLLRKQTVSRHA